MPQIDLQWWVCEALQDFTTKVFGVTAGLGSGKTHGECQWLHDRALRTKAPKSVFVMPTYQKVYDSAIPTYKKVLAQLGYIEGEHFSALSSPYPRIVYCNKQEIHFLSANHRDQFVAAEYGPGVIDEAGSIEEEIYKLLRTRLRAIKNAQLLLGGVPQGLNYYADLFDDAGPGWVEAAERDYINAARQFRRFRLTSYENPYLPADYVPNLLDLYGGNSAYIQSYIYGRFTALCEGNCITNYSPVKHVEPDRDPDPHLDLYWTLDFNASPLAWVSNQRIPFEEYGERRFRMLAIHNADLGGSTLEDAAVEFAAKHPPERFKHTLIKLYGDSSGHAESHKTRLTDYQALKGYLGRLGYERIEICALHYNPLESLSVDALDRWFLKDEHRHCRRCTNYQRSLMGTRWKKGERKIEKKAGEKITHWLDAEKYLAFALSQELGRPVSFNA